MVAPSIYGLSPFYAVRWRVSACWQTAMPARYVSSKYMITSDESFVVSLPGRQRSQPILQADEYSTQICYMI